MTKKRVKALMRVKEVQKHRLEQSVTHLARLQSKVVSLKSTRDALMENESNSPFSYGALGQLMTRRLQNLEAALQSAQAEHMAHCREALTHSGRLKLTERLATQMHGELRSSLARAELGEIVDQILARKSSS